MEKPLAKKMYIANKLRTGTDIIFGMDFLKKAEADLQFREEGVRLSINKGKKFIPLIKPRKKQRATNTLTVYETSYAE